MAKVVIEYNDKKITRNISNTENKKLEYKNILKNINLYDKNHDFKKYAIIKPSNIFDNIQEQTNILFDCGFNVVFEFLNDRDDFKITYINCENNNKYVWIMPFNLLKKRNKFGIIRDVSSTKNKRQLKRTLFLSNEDLSIINIIQSTIYYMDVLIGPDLPSNRIYHILFNYFQSPILSNTRNIKCAFIGDFIFDKINPYENDNIKVTLKYSYE